MTREVHTGSVASSQRSDTSVQCLLFDLDDTLYTRASGLFLEVRDRIARWTSQALDISVEEAKVLRREYYQTYGTTMRGLLEHHAHVDIEDYLDAVHQVDVNPYLAPDPALDAMLERLDTRKAIFTNAVAGWAERILTRLGVREHFELIIDVRATGYESKPKPEAYERALALLEVPGEVCVLVDDHLANLEGAAEFGMRTVLVGEKLASIDGVDFVVSNVLEAEPILQEMIRGGA
jgi:putative hydrolase of the HAD superfamily